MGLISKQSCIFVNPSLEGSHNGIYSFADVSLIYLYSSVLTMSFGMSMQSLDLCVVVNYLQ